MSSCTTPRTFAAIISQPTYAFWIFNSTAPNRKSTNGDGICLLGLWTWMAHSKKLAWSRHEQDQPETQTSAIPTSVFGVCANAYPSSVFGVCANVFGAIIICILLYATVKPSMLLSYFCIRSLCQCISVCGPPQTMCRANREQWLRILVILT